MLHDPFDDRASDGTDRVQRQIADLFKESLRGINEVVNIT